MGCCSCSTVEGVAAILLVDGAAWQRITVAVEVFILAMGVILWSTFSGDLHQARQD